MPEKPFFMYEPHETIDLGQLAYFRGFDSPTICNALELLDPARKNFGYTKQQLFSARADMKSVIGYARTAEIRSQSQFDLNQKLETAMEYFEYVCSQNLPTICAVQDLDYEFAVGANWGEVHTKLFHKLGALGTVTNGAIRDLDVIHPNYELLGGRICPSHRYVRFVSYAKEVDIFGMCVKHGDLIHMDKHGAVAFPVSLATDLPAAIEAMFQKEKLILDVVDSEEFNLKKLKQAYLEASKIHVKK